MLSKEVNNNVTNQIHVRRTLSSGRFNDNARSASNSSDKPFCVSLHFEQLLQRSGTTSLATELLIRVTE